MPRSQSKMQNMAIRCSWRAVILLSALSGCSPQPAAPIVSAASKAPAPERTSEVDPLDRSAARTNAEPVNIDDPSPSQPVTAALTIRPKSASAGDTVELQVHVRIARAHYVHAASNADEPFKPLVVNMTFEGGVEALGDWQFPAPEKGPEDSAVYRDSVMLRRSLKVLANSPAQTLLFNGELNYQACTEELCWPPRKLPLSTSLLIRP